MRSKAAVWCLRIIKIDKFQFNRTKFTLHAGFTGRNKIILCSITTWNPVLHLQITYFLHILFLRRGQKESRSSRCIVVYDTWISRTVYLGPSIFNNASDVLIFVSLIVIFQDKSLKHAFLLCLVKIQSKPSVQNIGNVCFFPESGWSRDSTWKLRSFIDFTFLNCVSLEGEIQITRKTQVKKRIFKLTDGLWKTKWKSLWKCHS